MIKQPFRLVLLFSICLSIPLTTTAQIVDIPDPNFRDILESELGKAPGDPITVGDMAALAILHASASNIDDLTGIEHATNLRVLDLSDIPISDISLLVGLTNLTELNLGENSISDISALAGLTNLTELWLEGNTISDISALAGLTQLTYLNLDGNDISDISALAKLTDLTEMWLGNNYLISDISALAGLTNLTKLLLWDNAISDISALAGLTNLTEMGLHGNSISDISALAELTNLILLSLEDNSISDISALAELTNLTGLSLGDNSISDISPLAGLNNLELLDLGENTISDISPLARLTQLLFLGLNSNPVSDISVLAGLTNLTQLWLGNNSISDLSSLVANTGLGSGDLVDVRGNPLNFLSVNTHIPVLLSRGVDVGAYDIVVQPEDFAQTVNIPDPNLRDAIAKTRGKPTGATITVADMLILVELRATRDNINDLTGLEAATNLTILRLRDNNISDLSPLAELTQLATLWLENNAISDLSPLVANAGLGSGDRLDVVGNFLNDAAINTHIPALQSRGVIVEFDNIIVRPEDIAQTVDIPDPNLRDAIADARGKAASDTITVADMLVLTELLSYSSDISDLTGLEHATNLTELWFAYNSISDISTLAGLTNLTRLYLHNNAISDISPLAELTQLRYLDLGGNSISDISPLANLTDLTELWIDNNAISDISPLVENTGFGYDDFVDVRRNPLNLSAINTHIPTLQGRWVTVEFDNIVAQTPDVNGDGSVNIFDLVSIAGMLGNEGQNLAEDVNADGIVNILDLVLVAGMFDAAAAAPSAHPQASEIFTAAVRQWLTDAKALEIRDPIMERGIFRLQQLLISLTPTETKLLPNYPNPFNPETWIPYRLAQDAFVTLTIYDQTGRVVRTIDVGHQAASAYESRSQAIYWDGRNQLGEQVASGVYFFHLSAGDYSATRKMMILK